MILIVSVEFDPSTYEVAGWIKYLSQEDAVILNENNSKKEAQYFFEGIYSKFKDNAELNYFLGQCLLENDNNIKKSNKYFDRAKALGYIIDKSKILNN